MASSRQSLLSGSLPPIAAIGDMQSGEINQPQLFTGRIIFAYMYLGAEIKSVKEIHCSDFFYFACIYGCLSKNLPISVPRVQTTINAY
jgi:hypothetical protein